LKLANLLSTSNVAAETLAEELGTSSKSPATLSAGILQRSIMDVVERLFTNAGYSSEEANGLILEMARRGAACDLSKGEWVDPEADGLLDSFSAIRDALRNAISVANLLGTCGGAIAFPRDVELERREAVESMEYLKAANYNEANERG
jgi:chaperonin GroEL (HSP60 family)